MNNTFNGAFAKAFPERTARNIAEVARQKAARKSLDPFGGALAEESDFTKSRVKIGSRIRYKGKRGRVTRYCSPTDAAHDSPTHVRIVLDDDTKSVGLDVPLADVVPDDENLMDLPGSIGVSVEARGEQAVSRAFRNPIPLDDEPKVLTLDTGVKIFLTKKVRHVFLDGHRVVVHAPGHYHHGIAGKVTDDRSDTRLRVKLDSGHEIHASAEDLIPEELAPAGESVKTLQRAIDSGKVSAHDEALIKIALNKIATSSYPVDPFGETRHDSPFHTLRIFAEKYASADTSNLAKRAKSQFERSLKVGDSVRDSMGRVGKITDITEHSVTLDFGNGTTGMSLFGHLEAA